MQKYSSHFNDKTILLVEDEAIVAMTEAHMLERHGFDVIKAYNARKAIEKSRNEQIDLVLMDIDLGPGKMDGTEAAEEILKKKEIPVVFLSSHTEPEIIEKTEKITAYGYIVKNSGETVIINSIKMAFKLHESFQKEREKEKLMSAVIAASPVAIHGIDPEGNVIIWNESAERVFGWRTEEVLGKPLPLVPDGKREEHINIRNRILSGEMVKRQEVMRIKRDGSLFHGSLSASPLYNDEGRIFGIMAIMEDITEFKKLNKLFRKNYLEDNKWDGKPQNI